jgi:hypothetical protein
VWCVPAAAGVLACSGVIIAKKLKLCIKLYDGM